MSASFEKFPDNKETIKITLEEWRNFANRESDDPVLLDWMKEKGTFFDSGYIDVVDDTGMTRIMDTSKDVFGVFVGDAYQDKEDQPIRKEQGY